MQLHYTFGFRHSILVIERVRSGCGAERRYPRWRVGTPAPLRHCSAIPAVPTSVLWIDELSNRIRHLAVKFLLQILREVQEQFVVQLDVLTFDHKYV